MKIEHGLAVKLAKRASGWHKGMTLPGKADQQSYGLLEYRDGELTFVCRGPMGWLSDSMPAEADKKEAFSIGALPSKFLDALQNIYGREEITLTHEVKGEKNRLVFGAEGFRHPCLMDALSGFVPEASMAVPEIDEGAPATEVQIEAGLLKELLEFALQAAPTSEVSQARAVITLVFEEETVTALATDGFLLISARTELEAVVEERVEVHIPTEVATRLYGLLSTVSSGELTFLTLMPGDEGQQLLVSFEAETAAAVIPLPELNGMPVQRILESTNHRSSIGVVTATPQTISDLTVMGLEKSVVLEANGKTGQLKAWSRVDVDAAEEDALACATIAATGVQDGQVAVSAKVLSTLVKSLKGDQIDLQVAEGREGPGLLVVEQVSNSDVSVLAAIVAQHQGA